MLLTIESSELSGAEDIPLGRTCWVFGEAFRSGGNQVPSPFPPFKEGTIDFVKEYFKGPENSEERIVDFEDALDDLKRLLKDISKIKRRQVL